MDPEDGGFIEGPKNLALALMAFELAWVDGGAATSSLASNLGLSPIHEKGTPEQRSKYMKMADGFTFTAPPNPLSLIPIFILNPSFFIEENAVESQETANTGQENSGR